MIGVIPEFLTRWEVAHEGVSDLVVTDSDGITVLDFALEGIDAVNSAVFVLAKVSVPAAASARRPLPAFSSRRSKNHFRKKVVVFAFFVWQIRIV